LSTGRSSTEDAEVKRSFADLEIVWESSKNRANQKKHKVSFEEAASVFFDPLALTIDDPDHSSSERRFISIGQSLKWRLLVVSYAERGTIRIINARTPTKSERQAYEED